MNQPQDPNTVKVKLKSGTVDAVVLNHNRKTVRVRLADGNVIKVRPHRVMY